MPNPFDCDIPTLPVYSPIVRAGFLGFYRLMGGIWAIGTTNIPRTGPVIFCPNHISDSDASAIFVTTPRNDLYFMARHELFQTPILGSVLRSFGGIAIHRDSSDTAAIKKSVAIVTSGAGLVMFPEGRLSQDLKLQRIRPGAALIALRSQAPIVPVGLRRTNFFLPYGDLIPRPSHLPARVSFGKPIYPENYTHLHGRKAVDAMTGELEKRIRELTHQNSD